MDGSRVATHQARWTGDKRTLRSDGTSWCGWCLVAHVRLYQRTSSEADGVVNIDVHRTKGDACVRGSLSQYVL